MESFLPVFQLKIENIEPVFKKYGFLFEGIQEQTKIDKLSSKLFIESFDAKFIKNNEKIYLSFTYAKSGKLSIDCSYHNKKIVFVLSYYLIDNNFQEFPQFQMITSYKQGEIYISKYLKDLNKLFDTEILPKIQAGTIANHYFRMYDPYR